MFCVGPLTHVEEKLRKKRKHTALILFSSIAGKGSCGKQVFHPVLILLGGTEVSSCAFSGELGLPS